MSGSWYVSFHGGDHHDDWNNLHRFSRTGKHLGGALDRSSLPEHIKLRELRGFRFGPDGDLYVANAYKNLSQILRFSGSLNPAGKHEFRQVFAERHATNPGLAHPFDVEFGPDGNVFVPSQDTSLVGRYYGPHATDGKPGEAMPYPAALQPFPDGTFHPGTFVPSDRHVPTGLKEVRHAIFGPGGHLYVADRTANRVQRYASDTGELIRQYEAKHLETPIHLLWLPDDDSLLVGSRDRHSVLKLDPESGEAVELIPPKSGGLASPAGLALGPDGKLYVASRDARQVLTFDPGTGRPDKEPFLDHLPDLPEFLQFVPSPAT
jgi:DNA-binding beta-propeller fold protein YncE